MKKTYLAPAMQVNGSVVCETRNLSGGQVEPAGFQRIEGSVGFNL